MRRLIASLTLVCVLSGCASPLPSCDGKDRRPINQAARVPMTYASCGSAV